MALISVNLCMSYFLPDWGLNLGVNAHIKEKPNHQLCLRPPSKTLPASPAAPAFDLR